MDVNDRPQFLHLEDNPIDAELIREKLEEIWPGCLIEQVDTEPDFILALERGGIDLIIADYVLPTFDGLTALNIVQQRFCHIPFIFVSGIMGEESAIESLKRGATDYVLKQRLTRLIPAVKRALTEVSERAASRKAEEDLKATQFQILQSDKMAAIGQLAAGIAHEINNPVGFVSSNLKTLTDYQMNLGQMISEYRNFIDHLSQAKSTGLDDSEIDNLTASLQTKETELDISFILEDIPNLIRESCEGLDRIKQIVLDLKNFSHPGEDVLKLADINHNLDSTLNIVWNELKYKATIIKDYGELPQVNCYPQQINQVFMNLLVNAAHAIENKGEIHITTRQSGNHVEIAISDTGQGIAAENLPRIFDPFFTTKAVGKGTGLGLNVSHNIVKKHHGVIDVSSEPGKGTTFTVRLPITGPFSDNPPLTALV